MKSLQERVNDALNSTEAEIERAKIEFTEELLEQMEVQGISRTELAKSLGVKPARVTTLLRGTNNFTLETMVRICRAIGAKYKHYIQSPGLVTVSYDALVGSLLTPSSKIFASASILDFNTLKTPNLQTIYGNWTVDAYCGLTSNALTLPAGGHTDLIESGKRIEVPKTDADLALAA